MKRDRLGSRLGFILLSAGCAIGIGNVWKFPYMAGQYGGGAFVLLYLFFLLIMGIPVMTMEFSIGRAAQKSPVRMYDALLGKGNHWKPHGYVCLAGNVILMMFYTTVTGWMLRYFWDTALGQLDGLDPAGVSAHFAGVVSDPISMMICMIIVVCIGFFICSFSLQGGLERVTKHMMIALLVIMVILAVNSCTMPGVKDGLEFYLKPDFGRMKDIGVFNVIIGAMNQAFFTLSLGIGSMAIFGSYLEKDRSLMGESINVAVLDTFVALTAGLIIFPACFTHGVEVTAGPPLIFETLPNIFNNMAGGRIWGSLFFVFMTFAAFSTVLAVFENIIACCMDLFGWNRKKTSLICCLIMIVLATPCALGFNLLSFLHPLKADKNILDLEDFIVSNLLLPGGSALFVVFCTRKAGWGWDNFIKEANTGKGVKVPGWIRGYVTWVLPILIILLLVIGLFSFFA